MSCGFSLLSKKMGTSQKFKALYSGEVVVPVDPNGLLATVHHGIRVAVFDAQQYGLQTNYRYDNESFRLLPAMSAAHSPNGVEVFFHLLNYLDFLRITTGRLSPVDGDLLIAVCNFPGLNNAFWTGGGPKGMMYFGNGNGVNMTPLVGADVVAHELTHALVETLGGLKYEGESGALNESFADCFGVAYEFFVYQKFNHDADPTNDIRGVAEWEIGEDFVLNLQGRRKMRDMQNPESCQQPARYGEAPFWTNPEDLTKDNGGVHFNSGVGNKFFYEMCTRTNNLQETMELMYRVLRRLERTATYADFAATLRQEVTCRMYYVCDMALKVVNL
jgi:Zn-dependent metalloprotease